MTDQLVLRLAYSKNMLPLNLSQWGGGLSLGYSLQETPTGPIYKVSQGNSNGNPQLNPWRSTNYGVNLEYYMNPTSMVALQFFYIDVAELHQATAACSIATCRTRTVYIATIASRSPSRFRARATASRAWSSIIARGSRSFRGCCPIPAVEFNFTYAPSNTGRGDLAGNKIPFQDNSTESGNVDPLVPEQAIPDPSSPTTTARSEP